MKEWRIKVSCCDELPATLCFFVLVLDSKQDRGLKKQVSGRLSQGYDEE